MDGQQKKVFWVEDDQALIDVYTCAINGIFDVEFIKIGQVAIDKIREIEQGKTKKPDLVVLDLELPDINGKVILEELKKTPATKDIPVYILTNYSEGKEQKKLTQELGAEKYLLKTDYPPSKLMPILKEKLK
ncbi:MAG: response regulator [Candidatus Staskawiczbacteria bacterium]|nr:response regulator [Candidatus Staskawiczbacteria bacterium]